LKTRFSELISGAIVLVDFAPSAVVAVTWRRHHMQAGTTSQSTVLYLLGKVIAPDLLRTYVDFTRELHIPLASSATNATIVFFNFLQLLSLDMYGVLTVQYPVLSVTGINHLTKIHVHASPPCVRG
jgi:hypothetical protein